MIGIVHLITYLDSQTGGMERQALQLMQRLKDNRYKVFAITCAHISKMRKKGLRLRDYKNGIRIYRIPLLTGKRPLNAVIYTIGSIVLLIALRKRYHIIHAHQLYTSGLVASFAKLFLPSKKIIAKNAAGGMYGDVGNIKKLPAHNMVITLMKNKIDNMVAVSKETEYEMRDCGFSSIIEIPNGVAIDYFVPKQKNKKEGKQTILFLGNLEPVKNIKVLIDAVFLLLTNAVLVIVGKGSLRSDLEHYTALRKIKQRVVFAGTTNDVRSFYHTADVFVLPSHSEGMSNTLLEAMSCGLPVIGSDIPAIRDIIVHGQNGYLFQKDDPEELADHIQDILDSSEEAMRLGRAARKTVEERFSFETVTQQYISLYQSLCSI